MVMFKFFPSIYGLQLQWKKFERKIDHVQFYKVDPLITYKMNKKK